MSDIVGALRARRLDYLLVFVGFFSVLVYIQYHRVMGDPDGFYHAAMAEILSRGVILKNMPWMQATFLREHFTDHHFLYHILLVPFVKLGDPLLGVKLATAMFSASFFTTLYWTLRRLKGAAPLIFTLLLFFSSGFLFRLSLVKANSLSLIVLCAILIAAFERRWWLLASLQAVYVWLYGGWLVGVVAVAVHGATGSVYRLALRRGLVAHSILNRLRFRKVFVAALVVASFLGVVIGLVVNPYWPQNLTFYWQQIWEIAIVNQGANVNVGGEWSSLSFPDFLNNLSYAAFAGALAIGFAVTHVRYITHRSWTAFTLMVIFSFFMVKSRRYIELAAPLMIIAASLISADVLRHVILQVKIGHLFNTTLFRRTMRTVILSMVALLVIMPQFGIAARITQVRDEVMMGVPLGRYQPVAQWLSENTLPETIVVQSDWDDWPMFFYYNRRNYYLIGLDPTFMYAYDAGLYQDWAALTAQGTTDDLVDLVDRRLHARYVLIEKDHTAMQYTVANNFYFRLVYEDPEAWVYRYVPSQQL